MSEADRSVVFVMPRFHTNMVPFVRYLRCNGYRVAMFVAGAGASEQYADVRPVTLTFVNRALLKRVNGYRNNPYLFLFRFGVLSRSSISALFRSRPSAVVIRAPTSLVGIASAILFRTQRAKLVFYTQNELRRPKRSIKDTLLNAYAKTCGAVWITPCEGKATDQRPLSRAVFVPFTAEAVRYDKVWFREDRVNLIMVGKLLRRKRHSLLLTALQVIAETTDLKFSLTLVGELSDVTGADVYDDLTRAINAVPFPVRLKTNLTHEAMRAEYKTHDLFVLPSAKESASVSNLEAMSFGLPVIVTDTNRTASYTGNCGWTFREDCLADLTAKLQHAIANRPVLKTLGERSWRRVESEFAPAKTYSPLLDSLHHRDSGSSN